MKCINHYSIVGTVGVPANYGGFETLADNICRYFHAQAIDGDMTVFCSSRAYKEKSNYFLNSKLRYIGLDANGPSSIFYDFLSIFLAIRGGANVILLLGVSGALILPFVRFFSRARIVANIDGVEWMRDKWRGPAKWFLRLSEYFAVKFSNEVVADNDGIAQYVKKSYGRNCHVIAYGGDHAISVPFVAYKGQSLPDIYAFALCRIEPENNVAMILEAFAQQSDLPLVFIGNWSKSAYGVVLKERYGDISHIHLLDPVYDLGILRTLRSGAMLYVHGHSAGGTNPSLVEMMHFGVPILAFDCIFNRCTTENQAIFFSNTAQLLELIGAWDRSASDAVGESMLRIAKEKYTWDAIGSAYFRLLDGGN